MTSPEPTPFLDVSFSDLTELSDEDVLMEHVLRGIELKYAASGWDQPDALLALLASRVDDTKGMLWATELDLPAHMKGCLPDALPWLSDMLCSPLRDRVVARLLPHMQPDVIPIGVIAKFEAWGLFDKSLSTVAGMLAVAEGRVDEHPDRVEARHVVAHMNDGSVVHLTRIRDAEPHMLPFETRHLTRGEDNHLAVIAQALCGKNID